MKLRLASAVLGMLAAPFGALVLLEESMRGFPDGHLTDYDRFVQGPTSLSGITCLVVAAYAAYVLIVGYRSQPVKGIAIAAGVFVLAALVVLAGLPILGDVLRLDSGQGG